MLQIMRNMRRILQKRQKRNSLWRKCRPCRHKKLVFSRELSVMSAVAAMTEGQMVLLMLLLQLRNGRFCNNDSENAANSSDSEPIFGSVKLAQRVLY
jgi:hypothetical protein